MKTTPTEAKIRALQAAADILADAAEDPDIFDEKLTPAEAGAALFYMGKLASRMQERAFRLEDRAGQLS